MDPSSDPGRDEYGLPPVDIEIPDDARDLDRDVQAYYREQRVQRRRARLHRLTGPLVRRGMVIPLVAVCLALTLLSGTLLTVVAGRQHASPPTDASSPARGAGAAASLPNAQVTLDGKPESLRQLVPAVLAWVPEGCSCLAALKELARQAARANVRLYLVGTARATLQLPHLATEVGERSSGVVNDTNDAVGMTYSPIGLTAILARRDGTVGGVIRGLQMADPKVADHKVAIALPALASPSPVAGQGTPSAPPSQPAPQAT
ncbi:MAG TPA: hypothetical protein VGM53_11670 [Streptosporangiaceae bacterium]